MFEWMERMLESLHQAENNSAWWKTQAEQWERKYKDAELSFDAERQYLLRDTVTVERWPDLEPGFYRVIYERLIKSNQVLRTENESLKYQLEVNLDENRELQEANDILRSEADLFQKTFRLRKVKETKPKDQSQVSYCRVCGGRMRPE